MSSSEEILSPGPQGGLPICRLLASLQGPIEDPRLCFVPSGDKTRSRSSCGLENEALCSQANGILRPLRYREWQRIC